MALELIYNAGANTLVLPIGLKLNTFCVRTQSYTLRRALDSSVWRRVGDGQRNVSDWLVIQGHVQRANTTQLNAFLHQLNTALNTCSVLRDNYLDGFTRQIDLFSGGSFEAKALELSYRTDLTIKLLPKGELWT